MDVKTVVTLSGTNTEISKPQRSQKGRSILLPLNDFTVLDLETTGLTPAYDDIIEVAAIRCRNGEVVDTFDKLVQLPYELDEYITELTGITDEMLSTGEPLDKVLPQFLHFIGSDTIVAHNANFDVNFLYDNAVSLGLEPFSNDFVDTMRLSRSLFKEQRHHRLCDLVERFGIECTGFHRALGDSQTTLKCYRYMCRYMAENGMDNLCAAASHHGVKAANLAATTDTFDETNMLYDKYCVFTGTLNRMVRKDAMQLVLNVGGRCQDNITKTTNYLILGNNDYCKSIKDGKSSKQKKAEKYKLAGQDIEIITEDVFYEMLGL